MAIYKGDCPECGRQNVDIMDATDTCVTCFSISVLEKKVKKLEDIVIANPLFKKE